MEEQILETSRLILRPWRDDAADAEALYRYAKDPRVGPAAGWPPHTSVENSREILRTVLCAPENYAVVCKATGEPVGCAGIVPGDAGHTPLPAGEIEIGYWLGVPYWGQGLMPEAVRALLHHCFTELGCTAVWCNYYDGNEKSNRVREKCGFRYHHTVKDAPCVLLNDRRTVHFTRLTKAAWAEGADTL